MFVVKGSGQEDDGLFAGLYGLKQAFLYSTPVPMATQ